MALPILYSLRNCPYAMRARIAIFQSHQQVALRDVVLTNKPAEMIAASAKATVPILVVNERDNLTENNAVNHPYRVIDESLDIMLWALNKFDPHDLLHSASVDAQADILALITEFDVKFKVLLEAYKCAKRYHESSLNESRQACECYIEALEQRLTQHEFLISNQASLADIALLPFIRQFARVERQWYLQSPYPKLRQWLTNYLQSSLFTKVMAKYPLWSPSAEPVVFGVK